ncbi:Methyltransferase srdJ [Paramyrothecium foliicola]|nr:Methyltransferase srdJ [Paramyrothecium foliicola]
MPVDFDKQSYWHDRFANETSFEWLMPSDDFIAILRPHLVRLDPPNARILHLGMGTSDLQNKLRALGFRGVTNLDYEPLAVERARHLERDAFGDVQMHYGVADATQLALPTEFDLIVDKSTVDAVACGGEAAVLAMARSIKRHLAPGAAWISLSYSSSRFDIDDLPFSVEVLARVPTPKANRLDPDIYIFCYLLRVK